jgi:hypothetical protein
LKTSSACLENSAGHHYLILVNKGCCASGQSKMNVLLNQILKLFIAEPGYYEDGKFGIRIESLFKVVKTDTVVSNYVQVNILCIVITPNDF